MSTLEKVDILSGSERFKVTNVIDGFDQVGFSLAVFSVNPVYTWREVSFEVGVITEMS
jgi:hypothetical protein|tara:strand:+ start:214 stop:387 length:174 start_codon:yes stop_codon:yes gene_type:complete